MEITIEKTVIAVNYYVRSLHSVFLQKKEKEISSLHFGNYKHVQKDVTYNLFRKY